MKEVPISMPFEYSINPKFCNNQIVFLLNNNKCEEYVVSTIRITISVIDGKLNYVYKYDVSSKKTSTWRSVDEAELFANKEDLRKYIFEE